MPVPPELEGLVLACLEKDRRHRPHDSSAVLDRLLRCRSGEAWDNESARTWWNTIWLAWPVWQRLRRSSASNLRSFETLRSGANPLEHPFFTSTSPRRRPRVGETANISRLRIGAFLRPLRRRAKGQ